MDPCRRASWNKRSIEIHFRVAEHAKTEGVTSSIMEMGEKCEERQRLATRLSEAMENLKLLTSRYSHKQTGRERILEGKALIADARNVQRAAVLELREHIMNHGCYRLNGKW